MNTKPQVSLITLLLLAISCTPAEIPPAAENGDPAIAFVGVNLVPMDTERVVANQTVVTRDGRIVAVGPVESTDVPGNALRVEGNGMYLMPGMAEMHGHIPEPNEPQQFTEDVLFLYVANGATTVRGMQGAEGQLDLRRRVNAGELVGPNLYLSGSSFNGDDVLTPEAAIEKVRVQKAEGWHLLKVQSGLSLATYDGMVETAHAESMRFGGHVPVDVGLIHAIEAGQETFDHMDGYVEYVADDAGNLDETRLAEVVTRTREAEAWAVPTMAVREVLRGALSVETVRAYPEAQYMPPELIEQWIARVESIFANPDFDPDAPRQLISNRMRVLSSLHQGGVGILLGTDAPQVFSVPGFSIHREMERMVAAGMTPYEVIASGTRNVGEYFQNEDDFGTIEVGKRADLILVEANPLEDVGNIARRAGVMVRGRWLPEADIQERLERIAASY
jgi:imidazolonepropionase-like amidohydrolase